jgi:hypothetical protein
VKAPEPKPDPKPEPPKEAAAKPVPAPVPRPRPAPPKKMEVASVQPKDEKKEETFNTDEISALLDKSQPTGSTTPAEKPPTLGSRSGSTTEQLSVSEMDALASKLAQCWNLSGLTPPDASDLVVKVKIFLNEDGSLSQTPQILEAGTSEFARTAAEAAVRAVRRCAPYQLPPEKYASWQEINFKFDPRQMYGG